MMNKIIRFTTFNSNPNGNGGDKRTSQITELLSSKNIESHFLPSGIGEAKNLIDCLQKWLKSITYFFWVAIFIKRPLHFRTTFRTIRMVTRQKEVFNILNAENHEFVLWESTKTEFSFVVPLFIKKGYRIVAIPHNIESLVPFQYSVLTKEKSPDWFNSEISLLKKCDFIFAISKEDTLLLNLFGVKAYYLPYFPTDEIFNNLIRIREIRCQKTERKKRKKKVLLLGSAVNPITRDGMINRIDFFKNWDQNSFEIIIAGYETGQLKKLCEGKDIIQFLGELNNNELNELLNEVDVMLVHQSFTSGALTRIIEMLIAGIPVCANFASARDYYGANGVHVYSNDEQMIKYLHEDLPVPLIPDKPIIEYEFFVNSLNIK